MDEMTNSPWKLQEFPHGEFSLRLVEVVKKPKHNQGFHWATLSIAFWSTDTWTRREYKRMCFEMGYSVNINWMFCKICRFGAKINKNEGYGTQWPMQMNGEFIIAILLCWSLPCCSPGRASQHKGTNSHHGKFRTV